MPATATPGLLVVDKPVGPTSHDVVALIRRALGLRSVGHAGTLDPAASGVLLVLVGSCTKLSQYLAAGDKAYDATVRFGHGTDTLDAQGRVVDTAPPEAIAKLAQDIEGLLRAPAEPNRIASCIHAQQQRTEQLPPAFSAVRHRGLHAYQHARRGLSVQLSPRPIRVYKMEVTHARVLPPELDLRLVVSKGYYVRALARDLGLDLEVPSHLASLRRVASGPFSIDEAVDCHQPADQLLRSIVPVSSVAKRVMPHAILTQRGLSRAVHGQPLSDDDFESAPASGCSAWMDAADRLVAVGDRSRGRPTVVRLVLTEPFPC